MPQIPVSYLLLQLPLLREADDSPADELLVVKHLLIAKVP